MKRARGYGEDDTNPRNTKHGRFESLTNNDFDSDDEHEVLTLKLFCENLSRLRIEDFLKKCVYQTHASMYGDLIPPDDETPLFGDNSLHSNNSSKN